MKKLVTKKCSACSDVLDLDDFYLDKTKSTGRSSRCKICARKASERWRDKNPNYSSTYSRDYYRKNKIRWRIRNQREDIRKAKVRGTAKYREKFPEKRRAQWMVENAIRSGKLKKGNCEMKNKICSGRIEAHHNDYSKPLRVRWLCSYHHHKIHRQKGGA